MSLLGDTLLVSIIDILFASIKHDISKKCVVGNEKAGARATVPVESANHTVNEPLNQR